jgi:hypothetical protein
MKRPLNFRLSILLVVGVALIGVVSLGLHGSRRGVNYYFPTWLPSNSSLKIYEARFEELTNVERSLPIVLQAMEQRPSRLGEKWEELRDKLPGNFGEHLPQYAGPSWDAPQWLKVYCGEKRVAVGITNRWKRMTAELRDDWLCAIGPRSITNRSEYLPLLREICASGDPKLELTAAYLLAGYRPLLEADAILVARTMTNSPMSAPPRIHRLIAWQLGTLPSASTEITRALEIWMASTDAGRSVAGALGLAMLKPHEFPPQTYLEPRWRRLPERDGLDLLGFVRRADFAPLMTSDWALTFLVNLLAASNHQGLGETFESNPPKDSILYNLLLAGTNAAPAAPAIIPLLTDSDLGASASQAFGNIAGESPELVPRILPGLSNVSSAAPLLIWLTQLGSKATDALSEVRRLANGEIQFQSEHNYTRLDPKLARRYGLIPNGNQAEAKPRNPMSVRRPFQIKVKASDGCPPNLLRLWPGYEKISAQIGPATAGIKDSKILERLPAASLAELAYRCLQQMTNGSPSSEVSSSVRNQ